MEFERNSALHHEGTVTWILGTSEYRRWFCDGGDTGLLWIFGIPGKSHPRKLLLSDMFINMFI